MPRLYSRPRWMASLSDRPPGRGVPRLLPPNGPCIDAPPCEALDPVAGVSGAGVLTDVGGRPANPGNCPAPAAGAKTIESSAAVAAAHVRRPIEKLRSVIGRRSLWLTELLSKPPHAHRDEHQRKGQQGEQVRPEIDEAAAFDQTGPGDDAEVIDGI